MSNSGKPVAPASHPSARWTLLGYLGEVWSLAWRGALRPIHTIRTREPVSFLTALGVHLLGGLALLHVGLFLFALEDSPRHYWWEALGRIYRPVWDLAEELPRRIAASPLEGLAELAGYVAGALSIELGIMIAALVFAPWAAQPEPLRHSWLRALKRLWLLTGHAALMTLLVGSLLLAMARAEHQYWQEFDRLHSISRNSTTQPTTQQMRAISRKSEVWRQSRPWYLHEIYVVAPTWVMVAGWSVMLIFWGVGCRNWGERCRWPAVCRDCGYPTLGLSLSGDCPECGCPVARSLTPPTKGGLNQSWRLGDVLSFCIRSIFRPGRFARSLYRYQPVTHHRLSLVGTVAGTWFISLLGFVAIMLVDKPPVEIIEELTLTGICFSCVCVASHIGILLLGTGIAASVSSGMPRENVASGLAVAAGYQSAIVTLGFGIGWMSQVGLVIIVNWWGEPLRTYLGFRDLELLVLLIGLGIVGLTALAYLLLQVLAARGLRYSNH